MTRIISWTLAGPGTAPIIGDALRSVSGLVNGCLVIWTGPREDTADGAEAWILNENCHVALAGSGTYLEHHSWGWCNDFSAARNTALEYASETGADWGLMLDTDERVRCPNPAAVRAFLADLPPEVCVVIAYAADSATARERFFRLPARHRWQGRTHEAYPVDPGEQEVIPPSLIVWDALDKTAEQLRAKNERDVALLSAEIHEHPDDARWWFYLGAALAGVDRLDDAVNAYRETADRDHGETGALSCIRAAEILCAQKKYKEAVAACARGLTMRADLPELPWIAAGASWNMGDRHQAEAFALLAKVHGERGPGHAATLRRWTGFCVPRARREGPDEILRLVRGAPVALTPDPKPIRITVTSTGFRVPRGDSRRCVQSVMNQSRIADHLYVCADEDTADDVAHMIVPCEGFGRGLLANLLPIWRSLPDDEVIVWLDGDDWLATDSALATVAEMHASGAWATYGQFITTRGDVGFCAPVVGPPREAPWTASHLKTFRAGLVKRIRDEDLRGAGGEYLTLAIDQAIMLPVLEMAAERAVFCPKVLAMYNTSHSFAASASPEDVAREDEAVRRIRAGRRYARVDAL